MTMKLSGDVDADPNDEFTPPQMFAREESLEVLDFKETDIKPEELPRPMLWNVLIFPKQPKRVSAGGIVIPESAQDVERYLNYIGQVVAMGPLAGKSEKFLNPEWGAKPAFGYRQMHDAIMNGETPEEFEARVAKEAMVDRAPRYLWDVKVGDWVMFGKYAGMNFEFRGYRFMNINDDMITQVIADPAEFTVYV